MSELEDELKRLNYDFEEELIEIVPLMDYPDLRFDGIHYNLVENRSMSLPLWIAEILEDRGLVFIPSENSKSFTQLRSIVQKEEKSPSLTTLDRLLYRRIRNEINRLSENGTQTSLFRLNSIQGSLNSILRLRARKILAIVRDDQQSNNPNMTAEEEWLFKRINDLYTSWKDMVGEGAFSEEEY